LCRLYNVFSSGASHGIYAIFIGQSVIANNGKAIGLLRGASSRMATFFYGGWRTLHLEHVLKATIHQHEFNAIMQDPNHKKNKSLAGAIMDIADKEFLKALYVLLRLVHPALIALRYCDTNAPMMDKIYYLCHRMTTSLEKSQDALNDNTLFSYFHYDEADDYAFEREQVYGKEGKGAAKDDEVDFV
jgi:hypothetical protein